MTKSGFKIKNIRFSINALEKSDIIQEFKELKSFLNDKRYSIKGQKQIIKKINQKLEEKGYEKIKNSSQFWDIYDKDKKPTGRTMKKNDWILKDGEYHLSVLGVIHRPDGRFLITQRVMTKAWAPGWWEVSGGAAQAGESSFTAVCREVKEEVGLDVSQCPGGLAYTYHRENPGEGDNYFVDVYRFELDFKESDVQIQTEEALGFKIATLDEIKELAAQGVFLHYDSIKQVFEN